MENLAGISEGFMFHLFLLSSGTVLSFGRREFCEVIPNNYPYKVFDTPKKSLFSPILKPSLLPPSLPLLMAALCANPYKP